MDKSNHTSDINTTCSQLYGFPLPIAEDIKKLKVNVFLTTFLFCFFDDCMGFKNILPIFYSLYNVVKHYHSSVHI